MADEQPRVDTRIYGAQEMSDRTAFTGEAVQPPVALVPVPQSTVVAGSVWAQEGAAQLARNNRVRATTLESIGAAVSEWATSDAVRWAQRPEFEPDPTFDPTKASALIDVPLNVEQDNVLLRSRSSEEFQYNLDTLRRVQTAAEAMGDNPIVAGIASIADPIWFGVDALSLGAARAVRAARLGEAAARGSAGAVGFAGGVAVGKAVQQETLGSEAEVWIGAALMGSIGAVTAKAGRIVPTDPEFPAVRLRSLADELEAAHTPAALKAADEAAAPAPKQYDARVALTEFEQAHVQSTGKVQFVDSVDDVKGYSLDADAKAVYLSNEDRVVVVAGNLTAADDIKGMLLHEVGVHMNAARVLGQEQFTGMLHRLQELNTQGNVRVRQAFADVPAGTAPEHVLEEALGYYVERNHSKVGDKFVDRLVAAVREKLRTLAPLKYSENDIMQLVRKAAKNTAPVLQAAAAAAPKYSKGLGATTQALAARTVAQKTAAMLEISLHKSLSNFSAVGNAVADVLVSDPLARGKTSVATINRAVRADLSRAQYVYEELLAKAMADAGAGGAQRILRSRKATATQRAIERDVYMELLRRNRLSLDGMPVTSVGVDPKIAKLADAHEVATDAALAERKRAGVSGADAVMESRGYVTRRWDISKIEEIESAVVASGKTAAQARAMVHDTVSVGLQRANGWDAELAQDVAKAIVDRAQSKGYFEDTVLRRHAGQDSLTEVRNLLQGSGISASRQQRVLDVLAGRADEAGKSPTLKHRVDIAMDEAITMPDGTQRSIADMLDTGVATHLQRYLDGAAADVAFASKGMPNSSDITKLRAELLHSIQDITKRQEASKMFDNTIALLRGEPTGEDMHAAMRASAALTQMVSLGASALWQMTEYSTSMAHYGALRTFGAAAKELPVIRQIIGDKYSATHLREVLSSNASQDTRFRPYINRMEDGFEIPPSAQVQLALQQAKQLVPYLNGMKYVQAHQARMTGNLIVSTLSMAAKGDVKAAKMLEQYGLEAPSLAKASADIAQHGMETSMWSKDTWDAVRPALTKMVDDSVLRANAGEIPAFAQFSSVGKFLFTFRGFTLAAHNKVLAGTLHNSGFAGLGLTMLYQFPLTVMATAANNTISGKPPVDDKKLIQMALSQMGALGLLSELVGVVTGNRQQFGSPGTIALDKAYKLTGAFASGDAGNIGAAALNSVPLLSTILPIKAIGEALKD